MRRRVPVLTFRYHAILILAIAPLTFLIMTILDSEDNPMGAAKGILSGTAGMLGGTYMLHRKERRRRRGPLQETMYPNTVFASPEGRDPTARHPLVSWLLEFRTMTDVVWKALAAQCVATCAYLLLACAGDLLDFQRVADAAWTAGLIAVASATVAGLDVVGFSALNDCGRDARVAQALFAAAALAAVLTSVAAFRSSNATASALFAIALTVASGAVLATVSGFRKELTVDSKPEAPLHH